MALLLLCASWIVGIYLGDKLGPPLAVLGAGVGLGLLWLLSRRHKALLLGGLCLILLWGGMLRFQQALPRIDETSLRFYNGQGEVELLGVVAAPPEARPGYTQLRLEAQQIEVKGQWRQVQGKALVRTSPFPKRHYGEKLKVTGVLETPPRFEDFDYRGYLERRGIGSIINYPRLEALGTGYGSKPMAWLYSVRERLSQGLGQALPEPQGSLAQAMLLGIRDNIPSQVRDAFARSGTAHVLAISGLHIGIVAGLCLAVAAWLFGRRRPTYLAASFVAIWLYAFLSGLPPSATRAAIMASIFLFALHLGRQRSAGPALALAAAIMVGLSPLVLWDVGFQLSFLAMAGLVWIAPTLQSWGRAASLPPIIVDGLAYCGAAVIATWPVISYNFGMVSMVSLPATLLVLPALPFILVTATLVGILGLFAPHLAQGAGWLAWPFSTYMLKTVGFFDSLSWAAASVRIEGWQVWLYLAALGLLLWSRPWHRFGAAMGSQLAVLVSRMRGWGRAIPRLPQKWLVPPLLALAFLAWLPMLYQPPERLRVSFLDVGHGDAILIQTPARHRILIDGGPDPQAINLELGKRLAFWQRSFDLVVLTHPHADHATGLVSVLERYKVKQVLEPGLPYPSPIYEEWLRLVEEKGPGRIEARAGQCFDLGKGALLEVLHPRAPPQPGDDPNDSSVVLRLVWKGVSFLFMADVGEVVERGLIMERAVSDCTVLKVAHQGANTSTSPQFLAVVDPEVAIISVGVDSRFGHPSPEVMERLETEPGEGQVYLTPEHGTIELITDGERLWVETEK
ncbi:MAG TPA: DNA internalization-related competence protein ComEC/Rec2 [Dehalococcoidia bacterium]|nr:DNA internalization-related competence protein ComEC/Rec2 [Dehalococcoidia bacterium]